MAEEPGTSLFRRLTTLFRSGPVIKRKVRSLDDTVKTSSAFELFRKNQSHVYSSAMSAYGTYDRMARYSDFSEMEYTPEISSALDIYSEETVAADEHGKVLHVYSENRSIEKLLNELFYDTLNVEFNLTAWARNLCKYGDFFLFNDVSPEHGVISAFPIPVNEIEREEAYDPDDPMAVRFRWVTQGNQVLENWQVCHMRVLGNDAFLPYGSSVLEAARRIWRQLILVEDAMLVYRIVRSPERRVFYVDVGNVPPEDIPTYMQSVQDTLKKAQVIDRSTGRVDMRYNPLSVDEDYYLPVRGSDSGTKIDTLAGGANATAIEDVEYIQKKLFAALKIPKAYLGYDEGLGAKATLSQEDIRFSRTIARIQRTVIAELNKIAIIHLYCNGFEGEDLLDFQLALSNPSTIAQQQKLELFRTRFDVATTANNIEGLVSRDWVRKKIFNMTDDQIEDLKIQREVDKLDDLRIESVTLPSPDREDGGDQGGGEPPGGPEPEAPGGGIDLSDSDNFNKRSLEILNEPNIPSLSLNDDSSPIKAQARVDDVAVSLGLPISEEKKAEDKRYDNTKRQKRNPDFSDHLSMVQEDPEENNGKKDRYKEASKKKSDANPAAEISRELKNASKMYESDGQFMSNFIDRKMDAQNRMSDRLRSTLKSLERNIHIKNKKTLLSEENEV
jgi:hypothetical protein